MSVNPTLGNPGHGVSVVVPVYRGADTLVELAERVEAVLAGLGLEYELILVNDASPDESWELIERLAAEGRVRGVNLMRNYGQHNALLAGIREASYDVIVTMDDDLQHPPEEIPRLLEALEQGAEVVYGVPAHEHQARWRALASRITKLALHKAMGAETASMINSFRAFRTRLREGFATYDAPYVQVDALLTWSTRDFGTVEYRHEARTKGASNYNAISLARHALTMITAFSTRPLHLASVVGFLSVLFGLAVLGYVLADYVIAGDDVPGFPFLASLISILAGAQLFALGVIGEYLARVHMRTMERPAYTVRDRTGAAPDAVPAAPATGGAATRSGAALRR